MQPTGADRHARRQSDDFFGDVHVEIASDRRHHRLAAEETVSVKIFRVLLDGLRADLFD